MSKHNVKDSLEQVLKAPGLTRRSVMKPEVTDGSESRQPNATAESTPAPLQSQSLAYQADPMTPVAVAKMAARWDKYHPEAATYQKRVTEAAAPEANTATKSTPDADSYTSQPEPASSTVPNASTTKTGAKPTPNSNGDWLPCASKYRLNYVGSRHDVKSAAGNGVISDALSVHSETPLSTTKPAGESVTASTPAATGNVEWDERTVEHVHVPEAKRDEWVADLMDRLPLGDMAYTASGDSLVLVHHTDDGFYVFDMVSRREGYVPRPELPLEDITADEVGRTHPSPTPPTPRRIRIGDQVYTPGECDLSDKKLTWLASGVTLDPNDVLTVHLTDGSNAPGMHDPEPRTEHDKLTDFFFGKPGNR